MKQNPHSLQDWLLDERSQEYFKNAFALKLAILACLIDGGNLSELARTYGISRQAASKHACRARKIYGLG